MTAMALTAPAAAAKAALLRSLQVLLLLLLLLVSCSSWRVLQLAAPRTSKLQGSINPSYSSSSSSNTARAVQEYWQPALLLLLQLLLGLMYKVTRCLLLLMCGAMMGMGMSRGSQIRMNSDHRGGCYTYTCCDGWLLGMELWLCTGYACYEWGIR
jgi:hypothetical protein